MTGKVEPEWDILYGDKGIHLVSYESKNEAEYMAAKLTARTPYKHWVVERGKK